MSGRRLVPRCAVSPVLAAARQAPRNPARSMEPVTNILTGVQASSDDVVSSSPFPGYTVIKAVIGWKSSCDCCFWPLECGGLTVGSPSTAISLMRKARRDCI